MEIIVLKKRKPVDPNIMEVYKDALELEWLESPIGIRGSGDFHGLALCLPTPKFGYSYKIGWDASGVVILIQSKD